MQKSSQSWENGIIIQMKIKDKEKFFRIYANLPFNIRNSEIIAVVDSEPFTWNAARLEVEDDTKKGEKILEKLIKLKIIKQDDQ